MNVKTWTVCLIEPNKFDAQLMRDLLRYAGAPSVQLFDNAESGAAALAHFDANVVLLACDLHGTDAATWTKAFRRNRRAANRKAAIFVTSSRVSHAMAEQCRHAGCNALIGKPVSSNALIGTITKVLSKPRPFIEAAGYVGPCRRAGIVVAGASQTRRSGDGMSFAAKIAAFADAAAQLGLDPGALASFKAALQALHTHAVGHGDAPLARACAALEHYLAAGGQANQDTFDLAVNTISELAALGEDQAQQREALAEGLRESIARAAAGQQPRMARA